MKKTTAQKIAEAQAKKQEQQNELKRLLQQQKAEERKERDKRHRERGSIAEKLFDEKAELSNEDFQKKLEDILKACGKQNRHSKAEDLPANKEETSEG